MGTNFYLNRKTYCPTCERANDEIPLHIGKSSQGWMFSLRIHPDKDIESLGDWLEAFDRPGAVIKDEYGNVVTTLAMMHTILVRNKGGQRHYDGPDREETFDYVNHEFC